MGELAPPLGGNVFGCVHVVCTQLCVHGVCLSETVCVCKCVYARTRVHVCPHIAMGMSTSTEDLWRRVMCAHLDLHVRESCGVW